jgi:hypothetical protein
MRSFSSVMRYEPEVENRGEDNQRYVRWHSFGISKILLFMKLFKISSAFWELRARFVDLNSPYSALNSLFV